MRRALIPVATTFVALLVAGCSGSRSDAGARGGMTGFRGVALSSPVPAPSFVLTDADGRPFDFRKETEGKVALLFFGYTHCPDVCPLHMANIAAVLQRLSAEQRELVKVVFVTTDPERDTPARLKEWLGAIDPTFIGLTGSKASLDSAQQSLGLRLAQREYLEGADSSNYFVGHAAQVFAFARDGNAYLIYPSGIRQEDWANDLPKLVADSTGADIRKELATSGASEAPVMIAPPTEVAMRGIDIPTAVIAQPVTSSEASLYFVVRNGTLEDDEITGVSTTAAGMATMHDTFSGGKMAPIASAPLTHGTVLRFEPGGRHVMLMHLTRSLRSGDTVLVELHLRKAGTLEAAAAVVPYPDVQKALAAIPR